MGIKGRRKKLREREAREMEEGPAGPPPGVVVMGDGPFQNPTNSLGELRIKKSELYKMNDQEYLDRIQEEHKLRRQSHLLSAGRKRQRMEDQLLQEVEEVNEGLLGHHFDTDDALEAVLAEEKNEDGAYAQRQPSTSGPPFAHPLIGLHESLVAALGSAGWSHMTKIQERTLPYALQGYDILGQARTGSGKTLAFCVPILHAALSNPQRRTKGTLALILAPTKELCVQTENVLKRVAEGIPSATAPISVQLITGGTKAAEERRWLSAGVTVVVGTPGRVHDHARNCKGWEVSGLRFFVLDEADRMLADGFQRDLDAIIGVLPRASRQTFLFSATNSKSVQELARLSLHRTPIFISTSGDAPTAIEMKEEEAEGSVSAAAAALPPYQNFALASNSDDSAEDTEEVEEADTIPSTLRQFCHIVPAEDRLLALYVFVKRIARKSKGMVFCSTVASTTFHYQMMGSVGFHDEVMMLHGHMKHRQRVQAFQVFSEWDHGVLFCTDVAARGLDIPKVEWILQYDPPLDPTEYIHRIGRTARAGRVGQSLLFLTPEEINFVRYLKKFGIHLEKYPMPAALPRIQEKLEHVLQLDPVVAKSAVAAYRAHVGAYQSHILKQTFDVHRLDLENLATAFALTAAPLVTLPKNTAESKQQEYVKGKLKSLNRRRKEALRHYEDMKTKKQWDGSMFVGVVRPHKQMNNNNNNKKDVQEGIRSGILPLLPIHSFLFLCNRPPSSETCGRDGGGGVLYPKHTNFDTFDLTVENLLERGGSDSAKEEGFFRTLAQEEGPTPFGPQLPNWPSLIFIQLRREQAFPFTSGLLCISFLFGLSTISKPVFQQMVESRNSMEEAIDRARTDLESDTPAAAVQALKECRRSLSALSSYLIFSGSTVKASGVSARLEKLLKKVQLRVEQAGVGVNAPAENETGTSDVSGSSGDGLELEALDRGSGASVPLVFPYRTASPSKPASTTCGSSTRLPGSSHSTASAPHGIDGGLASMTADELRAQVRSLQQALEAEQDRERLLIQTNTNLQRRISALTRIHQQPSRSSSEGDAHLRAPPGDLLDGDDKSLDSGLVASGDEAFQRAIAAHRRLFDEEAIEACEEIPQQAPLPRSSIPPVRGRLEGPSGVRAALPRGGVEVGVQAGETPAPSTSAASSSPVTHHLAAAPATPAAWTERLATQEKEKERLVEKLGELASEILRMSEVQEAHTAAHTRDLEELAAQHAAALQEAQEAHALEISALTALLDHQREAAAAAETSTAQSSTRLAMQLQRLEAALQQERGSHLDEIHRLQRLLEDSRATHAPAPSRAGEATAAEQPQDLRQQLDLSTQRVQELEELVAQLSGEHDTLVQHSRHLCPAADPDETQEAFSDGSRTVHVDVELEAFKARMAAIALREAEQRQVRGITEEEAVREVESQQHQRELAAYQAKLDAVERQLHEEQLRLLQHRTNEVQEGEHQMIQIQLEAQQEELQEKKNELQQANRHIQELTQQLTELQRVAEAPPEAAAADPERAERLNDQLAQAEARNRELEERVAELQRVAEAPPEAAAADPEQSEARNRELEERVAELQRVAEAPPEAAAADPERAERLNDQLAQAEARNRELEERVAELQRVAEAPPEAAAADPERAERLNDQLAQAEARNRELEERVAELQRVAEAPPEAAAADPDRAERLNDQLAQAEARNRELEERVAELQRVVEAPPEGCRGPGAGRAARNRELEERVAELQRVAEAPPEAAAADPERAERLNDQLAQAEARKRELEERVAELQRVAEAPPEAAAADPDRAERLNDQLAQAEARNRELEERVAELQRVAEAPPEAAAADPERAERLNDQLAQAEARNRELEERVAELQRVAEAPPEAAAADPERAERLNDQLAQAEARNRELEERVAELQRVAEAPPEAAAADLERAERLNDQLAQAEARNRELEERVAELQRVAEAPPEAAAADPDRAERLNDQLAQAEARNRELEERVAELQRVAEAPPEAAAADPERAERLNDQLAQAEARNRELEERVAELQRVAEAPPEAAADPERAERLNDQLAQAEARNRELEERVAELQRVAEAPPEAAAADPERAERLNDQLAQAEARNRELEERVAELQRVAEAPPEAAAPGAGRAARNRELEERVAELQRVAEAPPEAAAADLERAERLNDQLAQAEARNRELEERVAELQRVAEAPPEAAADPERAERLNDQLAQAEARNRELEERVAELQRVAEAPPEAAAADPDRAERLNDQLAQAEARNRELEERVAELQRVAEAPPECRGPGAGRAARNRELEERVAELQRVAEAPPEAAAADPERAERLNDQLAQAEARNRELEERVAELQRAAEVQAAVWEEELRATQADLVVLHADLAAAKRRKKEMVALLRSVVKVPTEAAALVASVLETEREAEAESSMNDPVPFPAPSGPAGGTVEVGASAGVREVSSRSVSPPVTAPGPSGVGGAASAAAAVPMYRGSRRGPVQQLDVLFGELRVLEDDVQATIRELIQRHYPLFIPVEGSEDERAAAAVLVTPPAHDTVTRAYPHLLLSLQGCFAHTESLLHEQRVLHNEVLQQVVAQCVILRKLRAVLVPLLPLVSGVPGEYDAKSGQRRMIRPTIGKRRKEKEKTPLRVKYNLLARGFALPPWDSPLRVAWDIRPDRLSPFFVFAIHFYSTCDSFFFCVFVHPRKFHRRKTIHTTSF
eukprot:gene1566-949_t